jgi:hypothetical protein
MGSPQYVVIRRTTIDYLELSSGFPFLDQAADDGVISGSNMKDTTISFKIDGTMKAKLVALAKAENRTLSNFIEKILKAEIQKQESKPKASPR